MKRNLERLGGLVYSQRILLALTQAGLTRESAYRLVQRNAMEAWNGQGRFIERLGQDRDVAAKLSPSELETLFDPDYHTRNVDFIFARVFGSCGKKTKD